MGHVDQALIDRVFSATRLLNREAMQHFVEQLIQVREGRNRRSAQCRMQTSHGTTVRERARAKNAYFYYLSPPPHPITTPHPGGAFSVHPMNLWTEI